jgi:DNA modification methylase
VLEQANSHTANTANECTSWPHPTWHTHMHKNHYTTRSACGNTATHTTMTITDLSNYIPKLDANGSNFWKWDAAVLMYAVLNDASSILEGKPKPSIPLYTEWIPALESVDSLTINIDNTEQMHNLTRHANIDRSHAIINKAIKKAATKQEEKHTVLDKGVMS